MFSLHGHYNLVPCVELCVCVCMQLLCTRIIQFHLHIMYTCKSVCIRCVNGPVQLLSTTVHTHTHNYTHGTTLQSHYLILIWKVCPSELVLQTKFLFNQTAQETTDSILNFSTLLLTTMTRQFNFSFNWPCNCTMWVITLCIICGYHVHVCYCIHMAKNNTRLTTTCVRLIFLWMVDNCVIKLFYLASPFDSILYASPTKLYHLLWLQFLVAHTMFSSHR